MKEAFIFAGIIVLIVIILLIIRKILISKEIKKKIEKICFDNKYTLLENDKVSDFCIDANGKKVKICVVSIPKNSSVTINSRLTWCLRWGGKRVGRSYPNQRYMNELIPFLKLDEKEVIKLIILYKSTEKVQKYLNESEIDVVKSGELVYDYKVICFNEIEEIFNYLL